MLRNPFDDEPARVPIKPEDSYACLNGQAGHGPWFGRGICDLGVKDTGEGYRKQQCNYQNPPKRGDVWFAGASTWRVQTLEVWGVPG
jgi:hypothetical protein